MHVCQALIKANIVGSVAFHALRDSYLSHIMLR